MPIGPDQVQVGVAMFSTTPKMEINLNSFSSRESLNSALTRIKPRPSTDVNIGAALDFVRTSMLTAESGSRIQDQVPQLVLLLTSKKSKDSVQQPADALRQIGVLTLVAGSKAADEAELKRIAFDDNLVFLLKDFRGLLRTPKEILSPLTTLSGIIGTESPTETALAVGKRDIVFLIDSSMGTIVINAVREFIKRFIDTMPIGPDQVQVGVAMFSTTPKMEINLNSFSSRESLNSALTRIKPRPSTDVNIGAALDFVRTSMLTAESGSRIQDQVPQLVLLLTSKMSKDSVQQPADALRQIGVLTLVAGSKAADEAELKRIAFDDNLVFLLKDFRGLLRTPKEILSPLTTLSGIIGTESPTETELPQIVGGQGGYGTSFVTPFNSTIRKIRIYYEEEVAIASQQIELAALGRPLFPGMLYDCRKDSFIPGVTLWDKKSLREDLDIRPKLLTDLKFSSSDSLSSKFRLLDVSASLKVSFLGGLVEVGGSAKYLRETKSSNQQSRVTMHYSETARFEQLTMTQLGQITYPQMFDQKTATHVVTAVLYGAQAFMVFDQTISEGHCKEEIERELNVMVKKIPGFSSEGNAALQMTDAEKKTAEKIACTFHGDVHLQQNPTTYMEALEVYKKLPTLLKEKTQNVVPIKVWLYPLHLLDSKAAQLKRDISTSALSNIVSIMEGLDEAERACNDLFTMSLVNVFNDIKVKLRSFQGSFNIYKALLVKAVGSVLPAIRGGEMTENSLEDILKIHRSSPFNVDKLDLWLNEARTELHLLSSYTKILKGIKIEDSDHLKTILLNPDIDVVVCLTITSLQYEDPYLSALKEFLKTDKYTERDEIKTVSVPSVRKWFNDPDVITKMKEDVFRFRSFSEANKDEKRIHFIISAISDSSSPGSSIFLYEKGKLTNTKFQLVSKPPTPRVKNVMSQGVSLKLQKSPTGETVKYKVEYKEVNAGSDKEEQWLVVDTMDEDFTLTGLMSEKHYTIRYRIVDKVGVSEASDAVSPIPSNELPQIVGGQGGYGTSFVTPFISTIRKIRIYYEGEVELKGDCHIQRNPCDF
ncbi:hypothetical protein Q8A67_012481 [Cirrhinus molitorella]|uniref:Uncharacterized protein n=1 Tax=Cirrhinus molitorella TaxID=172907 RepID=A0AA88PQY5_9TELE|nr:hypothetical protein Q8A67_012481 [Cirrhinus molitorella]